MEELMPTVEASEQLVLIMGDDEKMTLEFRFTPREEGTVVTITECGFTGTPDEAIAYVADSTGGYTTAVCAAKALLENGIELGAVRDKFPDAWV
jgi:secreted PhoX family phosphatase